MICPECKAQGLKSRVEDLGSSRTLLGYRPFYDEDGKRHVHDPNTITTSYRCSNDHVWTVKRKRECWCGWPNKRSGE